MIKITTLFKKDPADLSRVTSEVDPANAWALTEGIATRKFDGTACAIIAGELYRRYDVKKGREVPPGAIACQEPDPITGHWPHWIKCQEGNPADKYHMEAFANLENKTDGTYELVGEKVQGNPERYIGHVLVRHGEQLCRPERTFEGIRYYLQGHDIEGIVFHHPDGRMCKIRKSDYGMKR